MKNLKLFILVFALFATNAIASETGPIKPTNQLRAEIVDIIGINCPYDYNKNECIAEVLFTVNTNSELVVLSVFSPNSKAEGYLKSKLNYQKVSHIPSLAGEIYLLPLKMIKK